MFLYTSSTGISVPLHFTPGRHVPLHFTPPGRHVPLHFTPWEICSFTLHPLGDMFLYTSPPWQTCSFTLHPLGDMFLYTSPPADMFLPTPTQLLWDAFSQKIPKTKHEPYGPNPATFNRELLTCKNLHGLWFYLAITGGVHRLIRQV